MALSNLDSQRAIVLISEGLALAHSTDPEVWADWRDRSEAFLDRIRCNVVVLPCEPPGHSITLPAEISPPPVIHHPVILRADACEDEHPEDWTHRD